MIRIILMFPWALSANIIAQDLGFGRAAQIVSGFIACTIAHILIDILLKGTP